MTKYTRSRRRSTGQSCKEITALIADYVADRLSDAAKRKFEQHLSICPDCINFLQTYKKTVAATGSIRPVTIPAKVRNNLLAFLRKKMRRIAAVLLFLAHPWLH